MDQLARHSLRLKASRRWSPIASQTVYVAFVVDVFSRMIVGWRLADHHRTDLPLDALTMALWQRRPARDQLIHHSDHGSEYLSIAYTREVELAGAKMSTGTVGDSYDNALAETTIGIYKTELVARQGPWADPDQLELATLEWVDWYNHRRLHEACGYQPPAEYEALYYIEHHAEATVATAQMITASIKAGALHPAFGQAVARNGLTSKLAGVQSARRRGARTEVRAPRRERH